MNQKPAFSVKRKKIASLLDLVFIHSITSIDESRWQQITIKKEFIYRIPKVGQIHGAVMGGSKDSIRFKRKRKRKKGRGLTDLPKEVIPRINLGVLILFPVIFIFDIALQSTPNTRQHKAPETTLVLTFQSVRGGFCPFRARWCMVASVRTSCLPLCSRRVPYGRGIL